MKEIYRTLAEHQTQETWPYRASMDNLHMWAKVLVVEFKLEIEELAVTIERLPGHALGHFRPGHNGFGLRGEIALDEWHVRANASPELWHDVIGTLLHEMLHVWQQAYGTPGQGNYHNKEFRDKAAALGLIISESGVQRYASSSRFAALLASKGIQGPPTSEAVSPKKPKGPGSKLKLWQCQCPLKLRVGKKAIRVLCLDCDTQFQLVDPMPPDAPINPTVVAEDSSASQIGEVP